MMAWNVSMVIGISKYTHIISSLSVYLDSWSILLLICKYYMVWVIQHDLYQNLQEHKSITLPTIF